MAVATRAAMDVPRSVTLEMAAGALLGRWRIVSLVGRGGTSTVYAVEDATSGYQAALKVMRSDFSTQSLLADRFVREASLVAEMAHPCVPHVYELGRLDDGRVFLAMELLRGRTLAAELELRRLPFAVAIEILQQLCSVLGAAHRRGVVHRDLKPENIFLLEDRDPVQVKLVDWGIAKHFDDHDSTSLTRTGTIVGTPRYLAPEQARALPVDARADIYTLGLVAYELLLGVHPFTAHSLAETLMMQMVQAPPSPRRFWPLIPVAIERVLMAMLAKDPARRPTLPEIAAVLGELDGEHLPADVQEPFLRGTYDDVATSVDDAGPRPTARWRRLPRA
jgi:serine/threonine-protein kinase